MLDVDARFQHPEEVPWESAVPIVVPFSPETPKSGKQTGGLFVGWPRLAPQLLDWADEVLDLSRSAFSGSC